MIFTILCLVFVIAICNLGHNNSELFNILAKFPFTTSKVVLDI